jgi:hypothetical protein
MMPLVVAGCATERSITLETPRPSQPQFAVGAASSSKVIETRYEVRGYRDLAAPDVRHEPHAVYRQSRVPVSVADSLETVPRAVFAPASFKPLPASDELTAELATQKRMTADLRAMQSTITEIEQRMQVQYSTLVRQSAEAMKVREQLEAERNRVRQASEPKTRDVQASAADGKTEEVKW